MSLKIKGGRENEKYQYNFKHKEVCLWRQRFHVTAYAYFLMIT